MTDGEEPSAIDGEAAVDADVDHAEDEPAEYHAIAAE